MTNPDASMSDPDHHPFRTWGLWGVILGALALILVFIQIFAPITEPTPTVGAQIGEIAGDIGRNAWRSFFGMPVEVEAPKDPSVMDYLPLAAPIAGVLAVLLAFVSGLMRENWRYAAYGASLGSAAVLFHFFWWVALLFAGVILLVAIIENIGDIFSLGG